MAALSSIAVCSRTLSAIAACVASSAVTASDCFRRGLADEDGGNDEQEGPDAREVDAAAVEGNDGLDEEDDRGTGLSTEGPVV